MKPLHLPIASPCRESFAEMVGDDRTRFCNKCSKPVHDLSARTEREARALLRERAGERLCVRYLKDAAGRVRFKTVLLGAALSVAACGPHTADQPTHTEGDHSVHCSLPPDEQAEAGAEGAGFMGDIAAPGEE